MFTYIQESTDWIQRIAIFMRDAFVSSVFVRRSPHLHSTRLVHPYFIGIDSRAGGMVFLPNFFITNLWRLVFDMQPNKRKRSRLSFQIEVIIGAGSKYVLSCMSRDVSMNGIFVVTEARIPVGGICGIEILMTGKSSNLRIRARGVVARHASDGMGIAFQHDLEWWPMLENTIVEQLEAHN